MSRPIDAERAEKVIRLAADDLFAKHKDIEASYAVAAAMLIADSPTIDAEPVRHGTWEEIETYAFVGFDGNGSLKERRQKYYRHICGRCSAIKEKFCPNCGAIMDGGVSE